MDFRLTDFLPTTKKEMELHGWQEADVIIFSGDAYVDHPAFGAAVIGRTLQREGFRVAIVPQPDWHGDLRDFTKLGRPRLMFAIAPGCMDSMVNKYTANRRLRSEDAYSPDGRHDKRPEYPTIVYSEILRRLFPDAPIVIGGIEASLRRLTHYDYWQDRLRPSILCDSHADLLVYGMGERPMAEICRQLASGKHVSEVRNVPQTAFLAAPDEVPGGIGEGDIILKSHEQCLADKRSQAANFRLIEEESNALHAARILQGVGKKTVVVNPPYPPMTTEEIDSCYDLPYTRLPHPKYKGKRIPAYEMIRHSVNIHRGCFGGCAFCTISAHQGKFISSRSIESIVREARKVTEMDDFKGYITDLGGPSANMYGMKGRDTTICERCKRPSCIHPRICPNLDANHKPLLDVYHAVDALPGVKKTFIGSGVRYDLLLHRSKDEEANKAAERYTEELIRFHVSGRLKVAPEHTSDNVLRLMRKPSFALFRDFKRVFDTINERYGLRQQLIPYFISSHPRCTEADMAELAVLTKRMDFKLEQVQDFTPTPMTVSTEAWYTGLHPYTLEPVYSARTQEEKLAQRMFFFWYKPEESRNIERELRRIGRPDLIRELCPRHFGTPQASYGSPHGGKARKNEDNRTKRGGQKPDPTGGRRHRRD